MTELLEFISGLLDGASFVALALSLGGIACTLVVLRPLHDQDPVVLSASDMLLKVSVLSLCAMAGLRVLQLALKALALSDVLGSLGCRPLCKLDCFDSGHRVSCWHWAWPGRWQGYGETFPGDSRGVWSCSWPGCFW